MNEIKGFFGQWRPFSNFWEANIEYNELVYLNNEAAFQAQKVCTQEERTRFSNLPPNEAKKLGRNVALRSDWEQIKEQIMYEVVLAKFQQNTELKDLLLSTDDAYLEETNSWHDAKWGICYCTRCKGKGKNALGNILMRVRSELR